MQVRDRGIAPAGWWVRIAGRIYAPRIWPMPTKKPTNMMRTGKAMKAVYGTHAKTQYSRPMPARMYACTSALP